MGYNLTIVRPDRETISFEELKEAARSVGQCSIDVEGKSILIDIGNETLSVYLINQTVFASDITSDQSIKKLVQLASALEGRLRGDEIETYREDGSSYTHPSDRKEVFEHEVQISKLVRRWKLITIFKAIVLVAVIVIVVVRCGYFF